MNSHPPEAIAPPLLWQQGEAARRPMLVSRMLVPADAKAAATESPAAPQDHRSLAATVASRGFPLAAATPRPALFTQAMLENSPTKPRGQARDLAVSLTVHGILLAAVLVLPLYFTQAIDFGPFHRTLLVAPPVPAPPAPLPALASVARPPSPWKKALPAAGKLVVPRVIPRLIAQNSQDPAGPPALDGIAPDAGVPGGQVGGVPGGILSGSPLSIVPPPPAVSAPKGPVHVGGDVRAPRLLYRVDPVYPPLLRRARLSGDVIIDALIDSRGNVVGVQAVSGDRLLTRVAMEALRHWKYEPTILNGEAVSLELRVTFTFRLKNASPGSAEEVHGD